MNFTEWLAKNKITSKKDVFKLTAWFNHQATDKEKANLQVVKPEQVNVFVKTIANELAHILSKEDGMNTMAEFVEELDMDSHIYYYPMTAISEAVIPNYLISLDERNFGFYDVHTHKKAIQIDYSIFKTDFTPLDKSSRGEFTIHLPKTSHEVHKGASFMCNCMEVQATEIIKKMNANPRQHEENYNYIDAHIVKDNQMVGVLALEEINCIKANGHPRKSLFVNYSNRTNQEMENFCIDWVNEALNMNLPKYDLRNTWNGESPVLFRTKRNDSLLHLAKVIKEKLG